MNYDWIIKNWYFLYIPVHLVLGLIGWSWFNYSLIKEIEEKSGRIVHKQPCEKYIVILGLIAGPVALLITLFYHFCSDGVKLRCGLKIL